MNLENAQTVIDFISVYVDEDWIGARNIQFLYELLEDRPPEINISHRMMPSFEEHLAFVKRKPYKLWYVMQERKHPYKNVGAIYLGKDNNIGIFILRAHQGKGYGTKALKRLLRTTDERPLFANISPGNAKSIAFFKKHGFRYHSELFQGPELIQMTYAIHV